MDQEQEDIEQEQMDQMPEDDGQQQEPEEQQQEDHFEQEEAKHEQEYQTPESDQKAGRESETPGSKKRKTQNPFAGGKNFVKMNLQVKTVQEMHKEAVEKSKIRISQNSQRKSTASWMYGSKMSMSQTPKDSSAKVYEWGSVNIKNNILDRQPTAIAYQQNKSNEFITKVNEGETAANSLGRAFAQSKKEKSWIQTNASSINNLHSVKTLDMPDKSESSLVPEVLAKVDVKQNINLTSQLDRHNYMKGLKNEVIPEEYRSYTEKGSVVHNINNQHVQNMRVRTFTSNVF